MKKLLFSYVMLVFVFTCCKKTDNPTDDGKMDWNAPSHPYMAPNGKNNIHNDVYMTDVYTIKGPESGDLNVTMSNIGKLGGTIAFNSENKIITLGIWADGSRALYILDPENLVILDKFDLPTGTLSVAGGGYFYLDQNYRAVIPTVDKRIFIIGTSGNPAKLTLEKEYNLSSLPDPCNIASVLPDWNGNLWFVTAEGIVGVVGDNNLNTLQLSHLDSITNTVVNEPIANSFAIDETGGVFIVSDYALYRFELNGAGQPVVVWREEYDRGTMKKPGQLSFGSGTTPTLISKDYVAITDNAEPRMNVLIYKRAKNISSNRLLCKVPVFTSGASSNENSLIAFNNSIIVENNYGYSNLFNFVGHLSEPGLCRIDFRADGNYSIAWTSSLIIPSVVSKYSSANNLIYTYTKDTEGWYFTAVNATTGQVAFQKKVGPDEIIYNNHYSGIAIAPDGTAYVGSPKGVIKFSKK